MTCPGTFLRDYGYVYLKVNCMGLEVNTKSVAPTFPLFFHERLRFERVSFFTSCMFTELNLSCRCFVCSCQYLSKRFSCYFQGFQELSRSCVCYCSSQRWVPSQVCSSVIWSKNSAIFVSVTRALKIKYWETPFAWNYRWRRFSGAKTTRWLYLR